MELAIILSYTQFCENFTYFLRGGSVESRAFASAEKIFTVTLYDFCPWTALTQQNCQATLFFLCKRPPWPKNSF